MRERCRFIAMVVLGLTVTAPAAAGAQTAARPAQDVAKDDRADAFWEAARKGDAAAAKALLDAGVDVNTKFRYGATALSYACDRGHLEVVRLLLERGADANVKDTFYGATPLSWASSPAQTRKPEHAQIVGLLLKHGARGQAGALMSAIREGDGPMTQIILDHGGLAAPALSDALELATTGKQTTIVAMLERAGAKPAPVVTLSESQLARCAGTYRSATSALTFVVKDGKLQGGPAGQMLTLVPRSETTFALIGEPGISVAFAAGGDAAASVTVTQGGTSTVYARVEGK